MFHTVVIYALTNQRYRCLDAEIDPETQAAKNCTKERLVKGNVLNFKSRCVMHRVKISRA